MEGQVTSPADPGQSAGTAETGQGTGSTTEETGQTGAPATGAQSGAEGTGTTETATEETVSKAQHEQLRAQLAAADRKRQEAETALQGIKDKDLPEMDRMKRDLQTATERADKAERELRDARVSNAFFRDNSYKWHDAAAALKMADLSEVNIADDGTVTGMKEALKRLATANPWMLDKGTTGDDGAAGSGGSTSTGAPPMNGRTGSTQDAGVKALTGRLSAMRTRRRPS